jgi:hypothetical protein
VTVGLLRRLCQPPGDRRSIERPGGAWSSCRAEYSRSRQMPVLCLIHFNVNVMELMVAILIFSPLADLAPEDSLDCREAESECS